MAQPATFRQTQPSPATLQIKPPARAFTTFPLAESTNRVAPEQMQLSQVPQGHESADGLNSGDNGELAILPALEQLVEHAKHLDSKIADLQVASLRFSANVLELDSAADQDRWQSVVASSKIKVF
jgi:hypothetical protein